MGDRHTFRADWHAYNDGVFFVTICAKDKKHIFGKITNGDMCFSTIGNIINKCLLEIPNHHNDVELWNHVVMPNHIHMVLYVSSSTPVRAQNFASETSQATPITSNTGCLKPPRHGEPRAENHFNSRFSVIIRSFKAACTVEINRLALTQSVAPPQSPVATTPLWQRNYHEHIIRNRRELGMIMNYIDNNISNWAHDCYNSERR